MITHHLGFFDATRSVQVRGRGYFAGQAPDPADPDSVDGRFRILNVPSRGNVVVFERGSMFPVASTYSAADGTWRIEWLDPTRDFIVIGFDNTGAQNAAIQDWVRPEPMA
jgi:hypothetical protein